VRDAPEIERLERQVRALGAKWVEPTSGEMPEMRSPINRRACLSYN
jgi:hypothetical protein